MGEILLIRHGETTWSASRRHTSYTDLELTPDGERQARTLAAFLAGRRFVTVLASPRIRALRTAQLAGLTVDAVDEDLAEWNYGEYEGRTTVDIHEHDPHWNIWTDGCPGGESPGQVGERLDRVLARVPPCSTGAPSRWSATRTACGCSAPGGSACPRRRAGCCGWTPPP